MREGRCAILAGLLAALPFEGAFFVLTDGFVDPRPRFAGAGFLGGDGFFFDTVVRLVTMKAPPFSGGCPKRLPQGRTTLRGSERASVSPTGQRTSW